MPASTATDENISAGRWWLIPVVAAGTLLTVFVLTRPPAMSGDSVAVLRGAKLILRCVRASVFARCDASVPDVSQGVAPYPPYQYVPALLLTWLGAGDAAVYRTFSALNTFSFLGLLALGAGMPRMTGRPGLTAAVMCTVIASPLLWYAWSTFGELLAAFLIATFLSAALRRSRPALLLVTLYLAGITKETALPFLLLAGGVALWATPIGRGPFRRAHAQALVGGSILVVLSHAGLNWFRFGTLHNAIYSGSVFHVPGVGLRGQLFASLSVSPNAGIAWFWPTATALLTGLGVIAVKRFRSHRHDYRAWVPAAVITMIGLTQSALLASWWAPFGWFAWGPRLSLSFVPGLVLIGSVLHAEDVEKGLHWLGRSTTRLAVAIAALSVLTLPQVGILWRSDVLGAFFATKSGAPLCPSIDPDPAYYYGCLLDAAWSTPPLLLAAGRGVTDGWGPLYAAAFCGAGSHLLLRASRPGCYRPQRQAVRSS